MRIAKAINYDVNNGEGFRLSVWVSGCPIKCKGCHNTDLWDENLGAEYSVNVAKKIVELLKDPNIKGLSILGGEPLAPYNVEGVKDLCSYVKSEVPDKSIWLWTGYGIYKAIDYGMDKLADVVIYGEYIEEQKSDDLAWRGSSNQRIHKF